MDVVFKESNASEGEMTRFFFTILDILPLQQA